MNQENLAPAKKVIHLIIIRFMDTSFAGITQNFQRLYNPKKQLQETINTLSSAMNYLFFSKSRISASNISSFDGGGGALGASTFFCLKELTALITKNTESAISRKSNTT